MAADHWLDRLATRHTRRQGLKLALVGALGTLPLLRAREAPAATQECSKPCFYSSQVLTARAETACDAGFVSNGVHTATAIFVNPLVASGAFLKLMADRVGCAEDGYRVQKATQFDCLQPNCGTWEPDPKILCPGCTESGGKCCPAKSANTSSGYVCCACCHLSGDGCAPCGN